MIECDSVQCEIGWYHYSCVNLPVIFEPADDEEWFCPDCEKKREHLLPSPAWAEGTVLSLCVCLSVCLLPQNCCKFKLSQNLNKLQVTNLVI